MLFCSIFSARSSLIRDGAAKREGRQRQNELMGFRSRSVWIRELTRFFHRTSSPSLCSQGWGKVKGGAQRAPSQGGRQKQAAMPRTTPTTPLQLLGQTQVFLYPNVRLTLSKRLGQYAGAHGGSIEIWID